MQLEFDWSRRERCALANLEKLASVGVSDGQIAVVFLMQCHPESEIFAGDAKLASLAISQADAARWLKRNCPVVRDLALSRSNFRRAVLAWQDRGIAGFVRGRVMLSFSALGSWFSEREIDADSLAAEWERVTRCDPVGPSVTRCDPSVIEGLNSKNSSQSINQETAEIFVGLDGSAWERVETDDAKEDRRLYGVLRDWWTSGGSDCGLEVDQVVGAILAARNGGKTDPERYARKCLQMGLKQNWINKSAAWRQQMKQSLVYTGR